MSAIAILLLFLTIAVAGMLAWTIQKEGARTGRAYLFVYVTATLMAAFGWAYQGGDVPPWAGILSLAIAGPIVLWAYRGYYRKS